MAKRSEAKESADERVLVKFYASPTEHRLIKIAAAIGDVTIADLCKAVVLEKVRAMTASLKIADH